jgi:predicted signal transduction protein with EAL and GGDEF domain
VGIEALGRWTSPMIGSVPPDRFITTAERLGRIQALTLALFGKAVHELARLPIELDLSFNLSAHDICAPDTLEKLTGLIRQAGVNPQRITFELTETALMRDFEAAVSGIEHLRRLGARVALDDFGTGYSSLGYLRRLPLDKVKVDRSFAINVEEASNRTILSAVVGLCRTLGLECVIEGVESEAQLNTLIALGYRQAQGYYFAKPMRASALLEWIQHVDHARTANAESARATRMRSIRIAHSSGEESVA